MTSFRHFSGQTAPPGVKINRHYQISSGIQSMDDLLGGGIFLGTIAMIKQDRWSDYSSLILKYFMAQGIVCGHQGMIVSLDSDPNLFQEGLMGLSKSNASSINSPLETKNPINIRSKPMTRQLGELRNDQMKIAWRYQNLGSVSSDFYQNAPVDPLYCSSFDLTTRLDLDKDNLIKTVDQTMLIKQSQEGIFLNLLKLIQNELESLKSIKKDSPKSILRVGIDSFGSSLWPDMDDLKHDQTGSQKMSCIHFLYALKSIVRSYNAAVLMTVPAYLYNDFFNVSSHPLIRKMEWAADSVLEIESFSGKEINPLYVSEYTGLVHPIRLQRFHSLTPNTRISPLDLKSLGFKVQRKKFTIETFHLPPEEENQSEKSCSELF